MILLAVGIGLSIAASYLLRPRDKNVIQDDKPSTVAQRGAYLPYIIGRRRVGAVICWVGERHSKKEKVDGGKGGGGGVFGGDPEQDVWYESAWHAICVGPAFRLHRIYINGGIYYNTPLDSTTTPSGSTHYTGVGGESFDIYWGQPNQPVNGYLNSQIGINSGWPFVCYVLWRNKRLGTTANWPMIDYDIETRPGDFARISAAPVMMPGRVLTGSPRNIVDVVNGGPGTNYVTVDGRADDLPAGAYLKIAGNAASANGDYRVRAQELYTTTALVGSGRWERWVTYTHTRLFLNETLTGATVTGTVQGYVDTDDTGVNPAHAVASLLFAKWPNGLEMDPEDFDISTLDELARVCVEERIPISVFGQNGDTAQQILGGIMADVGFMIGWDVSRGKYVFRPIRQEAPGSVVSTPADVLLAPNAEIEVIHGDKPVDKLVFTFQDKANNFRDYTVQMDGDSQASLYKSQRQRKVQLSTVTSLSVANRIAARRVQEELSGGSVIRFEMNRGTRALVPGTAFTVPGYPATYRVERTALDVLSGKVVVSAIEDVFGSQPSAYAVDPGTVAVPPAQPDFDLAYSVIEVPAHALATQGVEEIIVPRIRANAGIVGADIWLSRDDTTYKATISDNSVYTGGTLDSTFPADTFQYLDQGPTFTVLGPDITSVLDLTGDDASFGGGRQLVSINDELFYVRKITPIGGAQYRLDGLIRARFDTARATHAAGSLVFIFTNDARRVSDVLLGPDQELYVKPEPKTTVSLPLPLITPVHATMEGKGLKPMPIELLTAGNAALTAFLPTNTWPAGGDARIKWAYRSSALAGSGAGFQGYGKPAGSSPVQGAFTVVIKTTGDVVKNTYSVSDPTFLYTQVMMVGDFGSEPAAFKVEVYNVNNGLLGDSKVITVNRN